MRIIKSGDTEIGIRASNLALLYYRKEFKKDLLESLFEIFGNISQIEGNNSEAESETELTKKNPFLFNSFNLPMFDILKIVWAMAKAETFYERKSFPNFEKWVEIYDEFSIMDCLLDIINEAMEGFFRSGTQKAK